MTRVLDNDLSPAQQAREAELRARLYEVAAELRTREPPAARFEL